MARTWILGACHCCGKDGNITEVAEHGAFLCAECMEIEYPTPRREPDPAPGGLRPEALTWLGVKPGEWDDNGC